MGDLFWSGTLPTAIMSEYVTCPRLLRIATISVRGKEIVPLRIQPMACQHDGKIGSKSFLQLCGIVTKVNDPLP
ncbi:MAG: hypothetical protein HOK64_05575 [Proteobacteria bacterium]|nr:hypothetical protein [Pseudomonadota bacterium]MBT6193245.1 hypothetical protein [Pseudomonadota bacterium]MBT6465166.1 hypothetical protein [Pseudomonadota bacterium]MBT7625653.1 hypothetical protein [Pseudomonadota bacterium]